MAKKQEDGKGFYNKGKSTTLSEVTVTAKRPARSQMAMPKASVSSALTSLPTLKAPAAAGPKKLGRFATAASDATSMVRGAANMAFGKNQSKTTGGKIVERVARVGAAALGVGGTGAANAVGSYGSKIAKATNKATGYVKKGTKAAAGAGLKGAGAVLGAAGVVAPVIAGQIGYKNRSAESTRTGIMNPGKGKANLGNINFDKPFEKAGRDYPLSESPNPEFNNQK